MSHLMLRGGCAALALIVGIIVTSVVMRRVAGSPMYYTCPMELNINRLVELEFLLDNGG